MFLEAAGVDGFHAEDADGAEHGEVFVELEQVDGRGAGGGGGLLAADLGESIDAIGDQDAEGETEGGQGGADGQSQQEEAGGQDGRIDAVQEVDEKAVAEFVDVAGEDVEDRADAFGGEVGLAEAVHLPVELAPDALGGGGDGGDRQAAASACDDIPGQEHQEAEHDQGDEGAAVVAEGTEQGEGEVQAVGKGAMDGVRTIQTGGDEGVEAGIGKEGWGGGGGG